MVDQRRVGMIDLKKEEGQERRRTEVVWLANIQEAKGAPAGHRTRGYVKESQKALFEKEKNRRTKLERMNLV